MRGTTIDRHSVGCCTISDGVDLEVRPGNRMHVTAGDGAAGWVRRLVSDPELLAPGRGDPGPAASCAQPADPDRPERTLMTVPSIEHAAPRREAAHMDEVETQVDETLWADEMLSVDERRCAWRQIGGEIVLLDLTGSVYFGLNESAAHLWPLLLAGTSPRALGETLTAAASAPDPVRAAQNVRVFLDALDEAGLLIRTAAPGRAG